MKGLIPVFVIFLLGYLLRVFYLKDNALLFTYDQARDALIVQQILSGDLKILGPPTSTGTAFHGALYYYLLAPGYWLGRGSPVIASYWLAFIASLSVFIVYKLTTWLSKKKLAGILAALFYAVSFEATQYATWLSNPTLATVTVPLMYLSVWAWTRENNKIWAPFITGLALGLTIQAGMFLVYHILPLGIWIMITKIKLKRSTITHLGAGLLFGLSSMLIAEFKFGFKSFQGILALTSQDTISVSKSLGDFLLLYLNQLGKVLAYSSYPGNIGYGGVFILALTIVAFIRWNKKELSWKPFLLLWLLSHVTIVSIGGSSTPHLLAGVGPAVSIILGIFVYQWWKSGAKILAVAVFAIVLYSNINMVVKENKKGQLLFAIQRDMIINKQLAAIDYTYKASNGKMFSINALNSPLYTNIVWSYLYHWYGQQKYGYTPQFHGHNQIGQISALPSVTDETKLYYLIVEPMDGIPPQYLPLTIGEEDHKSKISDRQYFGAIEVQKRDKIIQ